jgi:hypothetical protein
MAEDALAISTQLTRSRLAPRQRHWAPSSLSGVDSIQLDSEANRVNRGEVTGGAPSQQRRAMPVASLTDSEAMAPTKTGAHCQVLRLPVPNVGDSERAPTSSLLQPRVYKEQYEYGAPSAAPWICSNTSWQLARRAHASDAS